MLVYSVQRIRLSEAKALMYYSFTSVRLPNKDNQLKVYSKALVLESWCCALFI